ncbi:MAG: WYL domain-containing protein [Bacteroidales bacterium]|nr:WYL domain-containing protein [Bacteroidales bacterium]
MAANIFGRYVWLIDTIRRKKRLTYEEINQLWIESGLSYGAGDNIPRRTFHNHRKAIKDIFDIYIECDIKDGYKYYIDNPEQLEKDELRSWLIDSYATLNQLHADEKLKNRIQFDNIPSGHTFLTTIIEAIRKNAVLSITHQGFSKNSPTTFEIEPYFVKVVNRRWYVIARSPYYDDIRNFGLDRISAMYVTDKRFTMPEDFDVDKYFEDCYGIINNSNIKTERVVVKAYGNACQYLETLPIHSSQRKITSDNESATYEYHVRPTYDFFQALFSQMDKIEIIEPEWIKQEMKNTAENILNYYK